VDLDFAVGISKYQIANATRLAQFPLAENIRASSSNAEEEVASYVGMVLQ